MVGIIAVAISVLICVFLHFCLIATGFIRINPEWCIRKLKRHAQLLLLIWVLVLPFFFYLNRSLSGTLTSGVTSGTPWFQAFCGIMLFLMLFFTYLTFYYVVDRSVSTRIMMEIESSPSKKLTFKELKRVYDVDVKYRNELQGMTEGGFIKKEGGYYFNTWKAVIVAKCTFWYKKIFRLGKGG